ncbi:uncharacterized protein LOC143653615 [Tamandua tetradactyla]|uniref:uncharacterized protein LOC143653615 n=1 Tax=Tamandua tetradactyla TaxID=48850 RepID=UPI00405446AF
MNPSQSRRHRRRLRALKKKLEKMQLDQSSEKNPQQSSPPPTTRRLRRRARCLVWQLTQAALEKDSTENSPRAQKRQLFSLYDEARERCGNPSPSLKQILLIMLTLLSTAPTASAREAWAAVQHPPGILFITPDSPLFPSLQVSNCSLQLPCNAFFQPSQAPLNLSLRHPPKEALVFDLSQLFNQTTHTCNPEYPNCLFIHKQTIVDVVGFNNKKISAYWLTGAWWFPGLTPNTPHHAPNAIPPDPPCTQTPWTEEFASFNRFAWLPCRPPIYPLQNISYSFYANGYGNHGNHLSALISPLPVREILLPLS